MTSIADRYRSPAHTEDRAANGEMHSNKTPARANQWERSCFASLPAWPCLVRTCDRGRRLLVGLFKHHRLGAEGESYTLLQINKSKSKTQWLIWLPAMDALTPFSLFVPPKDPHLPSRASSLIIGHLTYFKMLPGKALCSLVTNGSSADGGHL